MSSEMINAMVNLVEEGYTPKSVWESSLSLHPGSAAKVNKATTGTIYGGGGSVAVPEGTLVTVVGVGGGNSGVDHHVQLPDGKQVIIPFADLGESKLQKPGENPTNEELTGAVSKIVLNKPLPQSVIDWVGGQFVDYGVELPDVPMNDTDKSVEFLMKADDQETLDSATEALKKAAGVAFKSTAPATMVDWAAVSAV